MEAANGRFQWQIDSEIAEKRRGEERRGEERREMKGSVEITTREVDVYFRPPLLRALALSTEQLFIDAKRTLFVHLISPRNARVNFNSIRPL